MAKTVENWPKLKILWLEKKGKVGIKRMVDEGAYRSAFPLHDVLLKIVKNHPKRPVKSHKTLSKNFPQNQRIVNSNSNSTFR